MHTLKRTGVECRRNPILAGELGFWVFVGKQSLLHLIDKGFK